MGDEYRLKNHPLEDCDDYTKKLYIDVLCSVASYENSNIEVAHSLIAHIMLSAEMYHPLSEHIKNAMQITPERYSDFFLNCREQGLQYIFLIDCLLIICSNGEPNKKQVEFVAGLSDVFGLDKLNFQFLVKISQLILLQDSDFFGYRDIENFEHNFYLFDYDISDDEIKRIGSANFRIKFHSMCYVKQFAEGVLMSAYRIQYSVLTSIDESGLECYELGRKCYNFKYCDLPETILYESYFKPTTINWFRRRESEYNKIILDNVKISSYLNSSDSHEIEVRKADEIILRNCSLRSIRGLERIGLIKLENCVCDSADDSSFWNRDSFMSYRIKAVNCTFIGYGNSNWHDVFGGLTIINNCVFDNVNLKGLKNFSNFENSVFKNCILSDNPETKKMIESAKKNNCKFIASRKGWLFC